MSQSRPALPPQKPRSARPSSAKLPLDGEVIPPTLRIAGSRPSAEPAQPPRAGFRLRLETALIIPALAAVLLGASGGAAYRWRAHWLPSHEPSPVAVAIAHLTKDVGDLRATVEASRTDPNAQTLRKSVDALKAELQGLRSSDAAAIAQLSAKLDKAPKTDSSGTADILARLDKLDHDPRYADIAARLDRIEHQVSSSTPTGSIAMPDRAGPTQSVALQTVVAAAKPGKPAVLDNWILRDVYSGIALVEGRSGSIREVVPGETLPGAGEVRAIERHGRNWVVVTSRGIIDNQTW